MFTISGNYVSTVIRPNWKSLARDAVALHRLASFKYFQYRMQTTQHATKNTLRSLSNELSWLADRK